jgi:hypothetical protein
VPDPNKSYQLLLSNSVLPDDEDMVTRLVVEEEIII